MSKTPGRTLSLKRGDSTTDTASKLEERLHKVLAQAGLGSRRALEQRIAGGLVKVNGETAQVGMSVKSGDRIELDGKTFVASALTEPARVLMYNKPEGEVTTREDPEGRPTIFDALPALKGARWIAIGRLDINTTGLLLLTTDGELANAMMHPSGEVVREYVCRVRAPEGETEVSDKLVDRLRRGVALDDGPAKFDAIERLGGTDSHDWFKVQLSEGRNREVRRLWESQGCQVSRLKRTRYGDVQMPQPLLRGQSQELPTEQVEALRKTLGLENGPPPALTLQPVIGQRKAAKSTVQTAGRRGEGYVNGHNSADEGRELRRFDHVREDRGRRGNRKPHGGLTVSGEAAARQSQKPFKQRTQKGPKPLPDGNPAAFRSWYVPDGVDTGPTGHRNAGDRKPKKRFGQSANPAAGGFGNDGSPRPARASQPRSRHPYGHPGNAPSFPSDHAHMGNERPAGRPGRGPRPGGGNPTNRPQGPRGPRGNSGGPRRGGGGGRGG
ncbi:MAG: pseudouridine synthase [Pseudoxanthomonas suwonensis]|nr:MAG: pseudouridine synthase [Pseudoxanthomonas suwonensis]